MKKFIFALSLFMITLAGHAQKNTKGCNPSACKPGNTKVEEALVITELRNSLVLIKQDLEGRIMIDDTSVLPGHDETHSLEIMTNEVNQLEKLLGLSITDFSL